jgi:hypothetical protein
MSIRTLIAIIFASLGVGCATPSTTTDSGSDVDFSGNWSVTRPGREAIVGQISKLGEDRFKFTGMYNLSGVYEVWEDMLVIKEPIHQNFTDLAWRIESPDRLMVILAPPVAVVGTDYTGVVAERQ